ncbi:hypothetical protein V1T75_15020 [Tenacibaculum sp. FZY0031]|uniref:hypothetical protein n=1 Tax=Tenacibaculum sp. FZY0031 TaxID=3116648 RepID=UPI002EC000D9|nr:hypothetical protein [Tenacibaculum sp. FZY0031]
MSKISSTLRENKKSLLDRKRLFKNKQNYTGNNNNLKFIKVPEEELEKIKEKIRVKAKKDKKRLNLIMVFTILLIVALFITCFKFLY